MTLVQAQRAVLATGRKTDVGVSAEVVDPSAAPETILTQTSFSAGAPRTTLTVAVPSARPCSSTQLAATYRFTEGGMGNVFAGIVVRNVSTAWCTIATPLALEGIGSGGQVLSRALVSSFSTPSLDELSPFTPSVPTPTNHLTGTGVGYSLGTFFAFVLISGPFNTCTPELPGSATGHVAPAQWRLTLPSGASVEAEDGTSAAAPPSGSFSYTARPFSTCGGAVRGTSLTVRDGNPGRLTG